MHSVASTWRDTGRELKIDTPLPRCRKRLIYNVYIATLPFLIPMSYNIPICNPTFQQKSNSCRYQLQTDCDIACSRMSLILSKQWEIIVVEVLH